jgi:hypothetical protein
LLGMHVAVSEKDESRWVRRTTMSFTLLAVILAAPLLMNVLEKSRAGQARPAIYPVSADVRNAVWAYIRNQQNLDLITMARDSVEPDTGITLMVTTDGPLKSTVNDDLVEIVRTARGNKDAIVRVFILLEAPQANP